MELGLEYWAKGHHQARNLSTKLRRQAAINIALYIKLWGMDLVNKVIVEL